MSELNTDSPARHINSVDASTGQPMVQRVLARKAELEARLWTLREDDLHTRNDIDRALAAVAVLLTGDLEHIPPVVVADMSRWLEGSKHVGESAVERAPGLLDAAAPEAPPAEAPATPAAE